MGCDIVLSLEITRGHDHETQKGGGKGKGNIFRKLNLIQIWICFMLVNVYAYPYIWVYSQL